MKKMVHPLCYKLMNILAIILVHILRYSQFNNYLYYYYSLNNKTCVL